ncbi:MAG: transposase [Crocinitomicaceae bacterium]|nr:transposase [Crocinitomicaceae bacterium]
MQHSKSKNNLSEISKYCSDSTILVQMINGLLKGFNLNYINSIFSKTQDRGIDLSKVFQVLFVIRFLDIKNVRQLMSTGYSKEIAHQKDVYYGFLNNAKIDWRRIVTLFIKQSISLIEKKSEIKENDRPGCIIVDDSTMPKSGKSIEFIGKVFDHCSHTYQLGMKLLTIGYSDGINFLPLDFSIHNESGKKGNRGLRKKDLEAQFTKERPEDSPGHQRVLDVSRDKIETSISMIINATKKVVNAKYVLADSWFICEKFIREIQKIKPKGGSHLHVIGLMKTNRIITIGKQKMKANNVPEIKQKHIKYSSKMKCHYISFIIEYKGLPMRAFWIRMKGQASWKLLICTDQNLSFIKAMKYYQIRWSIEVFFKECKQNLHLNSCQSKSFDAYIAHISITFMNYAILSLRKRFEDYETLGILFREVQRELIEMTLIEKIWKFMIEIFNVLLAELGVDWEVFMSKIIQNQSLINECILKAFNTLLATPKRII